MKEINVSRITEEVARLCRDASCSLPEDVINALKRALKTEQSPVGRHALEQIIENAKLAESEQLAICQDCGTTVVYLEIGQDVHIVGGNLYEAVNEGVRRGYHEGYLRKSMVNTALFLTGQYRG